MKQNKRWAVAAFIFGTALVLLVVFASIAHSRSMLAHSKTQLQLSASKLEQLKSQLTTSLSKQFVETKLVNNKPNCTEELGGATLTRNYDCTSGFKASFTASGTTSDEAVFNALSTTLANATYAGYDNSLDTYQSEMTNPGSWNNIFWVAHSGIPGAVPPQSNSTANEALTATEITIKVDTKRMSPQAATVISLSATQEYAACQSFFIPCDSYITK